MASTAPHHHPRTAKLRIVCLHGFSCNSAIFRFQTARLRNRWAEHLRQHPLVAATPTTRATTTTTTKSSSPTSTSSLSSSRAASPQRNNAGFYQDHSYYDESDDESSISISSVGGGGGGGGASSSSVDMASASASRSSSFSDASSQPSSNGGGGGGSGNVVVYNDVEFIFLESPREIAADSVEQPLAEVSSLFPGPYRTWFEPCSAASASESTTTRGSAGTEARRRSPQQQQQQQRSRRRDPAVERWVVEQVKRAGGVHGVLAFSDGAALTAALTLKAEAGGGATCPKLWDFVVLACGVDPYPDPWLHGSGRNGGGGGGSAAEPAEVCSARLKTPGLHVIGLRDEVYGDRSEALWGLVHPQAVEEAEKGRGLAAEVYRFDDGHKVPVQDADLEAVLAAWRRVVVRSGLFRDASQDEVVVATPRARVV